MNDAPSLHDLLQKAESLGADRFSMQCVPTTETPAGICVVLVGRDAISDISQLLIMTAEGLGEVKPHDRLEIKLVDSAHFIFQWLVDNGISWTLSMFEFRGQPAMLFGFVGEVCFDLCEPLTRLGCPTDLSHEASEVEASS